MIEAGSDRAELDELGREFAITAGEVLAARLPAEPAAPVARLIDRRASFWPELAELGWFDLLLSEEAGGLGLPPEVLAGMFAAIGRNLAPGPLLTTMLTRPFLSSRLPDLGTTVEGEGRTTLALVNASRGGWSAAGNVPRLINGRLNGSVAGVPNLPAADQLLVFAAAPEGPCLLVLSATGEGVEIEPVEGMDPCWSFGTVTFSACPIGDAAIVPLEGTAAATLEELDCWERILLSCEIGGIVDEVLEMTVEYVKARHQFGRPIGSFQAVKHMVAEIAAATSTLRNLIALTLSEAGTASAAELRFASTTLKAHAAKVAIDVCETSLQAHGGIGFTTEYGLHIYFKRALTLASYAGDHDQLSLRLGTEVLSAAAVQERAE